MLASFYYITKQLMEGYNQDFLNQVDMKNIRVSARSRMN